MSLFLTLLFFANIQFLANHMPYILCDSKLYAIAIKHFFGVWNHMCDVFSNDRPVSRITLLRSAAITLSMW